PRTAGLTGRDAEELASLVVTEQAKPLSLARGEVDFAARFFEYYAGFARAATGEIVESENRGQQVWIRAVPHGVVAGLIAWNFPAALFGRTVAPAIIAGPAPGRHPHHDPPLAQLPL